MSCLGKYLSYYSDLHKEYVIQKHLFQDFDLDILVFKHKKIMKSFKAKLHLPQTLWNINRLHSS